MLASAGMGTEGSPNALPGFIGQGDRRIEVIDVVIDVAAYFTDFQQLSFEPVAVFAHVQM